MDPSAVSSTVVAPMRATVVSIDVAPGDVVHPGQRLIVLESMKMEHAVAATTSGVITAIAVAAGQTVDPGQRLLALDPADAAGPVTRDQADEDIVNRDAVCPDLAAVVERHAVGLDDRRPHAVARRRRSGQRTTRENVADLVDPGTFVEYGPLVIAAQRGRRAVEELIATTPADGLVAGLGRVAGAETVVLSYDYTVLAGTQGMHGHRKKDRLFEVAERLRLPIVVFTEGGGGRPGDTDALGVTALDVMAFHLFARLSGLVPLVAITSGHCFAGNAVLLGCCDVVIATKDSNIGMAGPAMVEGGGLGTHAPEEIGPMAVQVPNGVVDVAVADEAEAVAVARRYLSYFRGPREGWACADQRLLRHAVPDNRLRAYDIRFLIDTLADTGSVLELRRGFGAAVVMV